MSKGSGFSRWNLFLVKFVEMTTNGLKHYIKLVGKAAGGLRGLTLILKEVLLCIAMSDSIACEMACERVNQLGKISLLSYFQKLS